MLVTDKIGRESRAVWRFDPATSPHLSSMRSAVHAFDQPELDRRRGDMFLDGRRSYCAVRARQLLLRVLRIPPRCMSRCRRVESMLKRGVEQCKG